MNIVSMLFGETRPASSMFRYSTRRERTVRILLVIAFFYALLNGSRFNLIEGLYGLTRLFTMRMPSDSFWSVIGLVVVAVLAIGLFAFAERRWKLARTQTDIPLLTLMTLAVSGAVGVLAAIVGHLFGWTWHGYWVAFEWTWQIPAGFFVGKGLNWSVVDRQIAGVQAVDQRSTGEHEHPVDVTVVDEHHGN